MPKKRGGVHPIASGRSETLAAVLHLSESLQDRSTTFGHTSFDHAAFDCSGLQEFQQRLSQLGVEYTSARVTELKRVQLFLSEPAGNGVELNFPDE